MKTHQAGRSKFLMIGVVMALSMTASGCTTTSSGSGIFSPKFTAASASSGDKFLTALNGGLISRANIGRMSQNDMRLALKAEYDALEKAPTGQAVPWAGSGLGGQVTAAAPYQVGSQNCRQYTQSVAINGQQMLARGAACRNDDGTWTLLN